MPRIGKSPPKTTSTKPFGLYTSGAPTKIKKNFGLVTGSGVRARNYFADVWASLGSVWGGKLSSYYRLINETKEQALFSLIQQAKAMGANAVINLKMDVTTFSMINSIGVNVYGTAVKL